MNARSLNISASPSATVWPALSGNIEHSEIMRPAPGRTAIKIRESSGSNRFGRDLLGLGAAARAGRGQVRNFAHRLAVDDADLTLAIHGWARRPAPFSRLAAKLVAKERVAEFALFFGLGVAVGNGECALGTAQFFERRHPLV